MLMGRMTPTRSSAHNWTSASTAAINDTAARLCTTAFGVPVVPLEKPIAQGADRSGGAASNAWSWWADSEAMSSAVTVSVGLTRVHCRSRSAWGATGLMPTQIAPSKAHAR